MSKKFLFTNRGIDTVPDAFSITPKVGQPRSTTVYSDPTMLSGINSNITLNVTGGTIGPNSGTQGSSHVYTPGSSFVVGLLTSAAYSTATLAHVTAPGGVAADFSATTQADPAAIPTLSPHPSWNGGADTGTGIPTQQALITRKPVGVILAGYTLDRMTGDYYICIGAAAPGGIANVAASGDCITTNNNSPGLRQYTLVNGVVKTYFGYHFRVDGAAFRAINEVTGKAHFYFTITAIDGSMQPRIIGGDGLGTGSPWQANWTEAEFMPMQLLPRPTFHDGQKTVGAVGCDYGSLDAALANVGSWGLKAPKILVKDNGTQTVQDRAQWDGNEGYVGIYADVGKAVTIQNGANFDPTGATWNIRMGANQLMFATGVTVDCKNLQYFIGSSFGKPFRFHCNIINSAGPRLVTHQYWNGGPHPGFGTTYNYTGQALYSYYDGCDINGPWAGSYSHRFIANTVSHMNQGVFEKVRANAYNFMTDIGVDPAFPGNIPAVNKIMTIAYSGPATTAHVEGEFRTDPCTFKLYTNGTLRFTVSFPKGSAYRPYQAGQKTSEVIAALTAANATAGTGFTFTATNDDTHWWPSYINQGSYLFENIKGTQIAAPAGTGSLDVMAGVDMHTEIWHMYDNDYAGGDNFLMYANKMPLNSHTTSLFNCGQAGAAAVLNCFFTKSVGSGQASGWLGRSVIVAHCAFDDGCSHYVDTTGAGSVFSHIIMSGSVGKIIGGNDGLGLHHGEWSNDMAHKYLFQVTGVQGPPSGATDLPATCFDLGSFANFKAQFVNYDAGDLHVAPGSAVYNYTVAPDPNCPYDIDNQPRNLAGDVVGPYRKAA